MLRKLIVKGRRVATNYAHIYCKMKRKGTIFFVRIAVEAALYFVLTFFVPAISYGPLQFRVGEALTLLPIIFPEATIGVTIGCLLANVFSPYAWYDMVFGTLATLISAVATYFIGKGLKDKKLWLKCLIGGIPPIVVNALVLPLIWYITGTDLGYFINMGMIALTQAGAVWVLGTPLVLGLDKAKLAIKIGNK